MSKFQCLHMLCLSRFDLNKVSWEVIQCGLAPSRGRIEKSKAFCVYLYMPPINTQQQVYFQINHNERKREYI